MRDELLTLPEPAVRVQQYELPAHIDGHLVECALGHTLSDWEGLYTADQLRAAVLEERERCADICDGVAEVCANSANGMGKVAGMSASRSCASLIRGETV